MSLATFEANPDSENEPWIERPAIDGGPFRIWHLMFFALCAFGVFVILICCCIRIRVPRTKQEIEADFKRKKIATKFRKRLKIISNQDMESVDLRKALEIIIEADYKEDERQDEDKEKLIQVEAQPEKSRKINFGDKVTKIIQIGRLSEKFQDMQC